MLQYVTNKLESQSIEANNSKERQKDYVNTTVSDQIHNPGLPGYNFIQDLL